MPTQAQIKRRYEKKLKEVVKRYDNLDHQTIRGMVGLLQDLRKSVAVALVEGSDFQQFRARAVTANVNQLIDSFNAQLASQTAQTFRQAHQLGQASVIEPLQAAEITGVFFKPSVAQLNAVVDFSADLITNITGEMRGKINTQLRLSALGQKSVFETMKDITRVLGVKSRDGVWGTFNRPDVVKGVAARAEAILRTETTRVYNLAAHSQQLATAENVPGLKKQWVSTGDNRTRLSHLNAHGQAVSVDQPFKVGGSQLMFPGDPAAPAGETINCRCTTITILPDLNVTFEIDDEIEAEKVARRKATKATVLIKQTLKR